MNFTNKLRNFRVDIALAFLVLARLGCAALSNLPFFSMAFIFGYGMLFVLLFIATARLNTAEFLIVTFSALYTLYVVGQTLVAGKDLFGTEAFNSYIIFFLVCIYLWLKRQSGTVKKYLLGTVLLGCAFTYVYSIIVLYFDPTASRVSATHILDKSPYDVLNAVGSFDAVYGAVAMLVILLYMRRGVVGRKKRFLITTLLVLDIIFIVMASYATALVLMVLALALYVGNKNKFFTFVMFLVLVLLVFFHEPVGGWIINLSKSITYSEIVSEKLGEFGYMIQTFELAGTYSGDEGRFARMIMSWDVFVAYPLLGGYTVSGATVGGHSELFDMMGRFGIVGLFLSVMLFVSMHKDIKEGSDKDGKKTAFVVYILFAISAVMNPALYTLQILPIIIVLPLAIDLSHGEDKTVEASEQGNFLKVAKGKSV